MLETCSKQAAVPRRLGPLDRLRATQGCGIGSSCRSHAALGIKAFPVFEARCTGSSNSQTVWPAGLELRLVCNDWGARCKVVRVVQVQQIRSWQGSSKL